MLFIMLHAEKLAPWDAFIMWAQYIRNINLSQLNVKGFYRNCAHLNQVKCNE